ncbi:hypothetical protein KUG85_05880 [Nitratireductor sp. L1-7-SE]|uniref:Uncharacterized protein n=1 Tax=Nitratireductor rhodophyticola TaxID=2854036 RepID=A0ABS7R8T7_9HYPH|nr:hypothetical protein [Nitratireductor rhodophyticola]MBY8917351.1 hypothetical protein [Nitratireductor rhodophyticola]MBY8920220.1 hypothetical protein [Nitratireductor rhodophyticola]
MTAGKGWVLSLRDRKIWDLDLDSFFIHRFGVAGMGRLSLNPQQPRAIEKLHHCRVATGE